MAANPTTTTTLTELVQAEFVNPAILDYAVDFTVAAPFCNWLDLRGKATKVGSFPRWVLDAAEDLGDELSNMTSVALETTAVNVTGAEVGLFRRITYASVEETIIGRTLFDFLVRDSGNLLAVSLDDDICALYGSFSTSVGTSGANLSIANMVEAQASIRSNKMRGDVVYVLDDQQALDYEAALAASSSTTINNMVNHVTGQGGFLGTFFGHEVWTTGLCDASGTSDVLGACYIRGDTNPTSSAIGAVLTRDIQVELDKDIQQRQHLFAATAKWGVAEINDDAGVELLTDA